MSNAPRPFDIDESSRRYEAKREQGDAAHMRWCAVYGAAVARMVGRIGGGSDFTPARAPNAAEWVAIVDAARTEADAAAEAWAMLDATGAGG